MDGSPRQKGGAVMTKLYTLTETTLAVGKSVHKIHPAANMFPMLSDADLQALADNIKKEGLCEGVSIQPRNADSTDGKILDGRNRLVACHMAKVPLFYNHVETTDPVGFIVARNIHRRHLTPEQRQDMLAKLIAMQPEKSDRQIAKQVKKSPTTVGKARKKAEAAGTCPPVDTRTDTKGRKQPASKPGPKETRDPDASPKALGNFMYAVDHWLPQMNAADLKAANRYYIEASVARQQGERANGSADLTEEHRAAMEKLSAL
jgi:hypothetical protein